VSVTNLRVVVVVVIVAASMDVMRRRTCATCCPLKQHEGLRVVVEQMHNRASTEALRTKQVAQ
jgi:hypothetical protein